ncbi:MAG: hypothetical protein QXQ57_08680 [Sulfolobales archaeon]
MIVPNTEIYRDIRIPKNILERRSLPKASVPIGCSSEGGLKGLETIVLKGSRNPPKIEAAAKITSVISIARPMKILGSLNIAL